MTHSFPTRRSAELGARRGRRPGQGLKAAMGEEDMRQHLASGHSAARCLAGIFLALICLLPASCTDSRDTITVGSKNFGESNVLAQMFAILIRERGIDRTSTRLNSSH